MSISITTATPSRKREQTLKVIGVFLSIAVLLVNVVFAATPANASQAFAVAWTGIGIYPRSAPSMDGSKIGEALSDGTMVSVQCELEGQSVTSDSGTSAIWEKLVDGSFLPNAFVDTGASGWTPGIPQCEAQGTSLELFSRYLAAQWATENAGDLLLPFVSECTIFVSHSLWAAGIESTPEWTQSSNDVDKLGVRAYGTPGPTKTATSADYFKNYVVQSGLGTVHEIEWGDNTAGGAELGDVIGYDWNEPGPDGVLDHLAIVTSIDKNGYPSVTQRTPVRVNRFWSWDTGNNGWIQDTHTYGIHINY
jgi:hypothetical protein